MYALKTAPTAAKEKWNQIMNLKKVRGGKLNENEGLDFYLPHLAHHTACNRQYTIDTACPGTYQELDHALAI